MRYLGLVSTSDDAPTEPDTGHAAYTNDTPLTRHNAINHHHTNDRQTLLRNSLRG
ncbi:hypothetical protein GCM10027162_45810 [Streptomyces incanus]